VESSSWRLVLKVEVQYYRWLTDLGLGVGWIRGRGSLSVYLALGCYAPRLGGRVLLLPRGVWILRCGDGSRKLGEEDFCIFAPMSGLGGRRVCRGMNRAFVSL